MSFSVKKPRQTREDLVDFLRSLVVALEQGTFRWEGNSLPIPQVADLQLQGQEGKLQLEISWSPNKDL